VNSNGNEIQAYNCIKPRNQEKSAWKAHAAKPDFVAVAIVNQPVAG